MARNMRGRPWCRGSPRRGPRRRRGKRRMQQQHPSQSLTMDATKPNTVTEPPPYRPRDNRSPRNLLDAVERFVSRAIDSDETLGRCLRLMGRVTLLAGLLILGLMTLVVGIVVAIKLSGLSPWIAGGIGITGTVAGSIAGWAGIRRLGRRGTRPKTNRATIRRSG